MSTNPFESLILRFRDVVTERDGTVKAHREFCALKRGHVWWAWWNKAGERVPPQEFATLNTLASRPEGLQVWLYDSGQGQLYLAHCRALSWSQMLDATIPSPQKARTPSYYRQREYLAWFKFTAIEGPLDDPDTALRKLAYVRVDGLFQEEASLYTPFYGKQIAGVRELKQQDRSLWFVRSSRRGDPKHEISLLNSRQFTPRHFSPDFEQTRSSRLLWLSDLHFSEDGHHHFPTQSTASAKSLAAQLQAALQDLDSRDLAGLILSGDFTWRAAAGEYQQMLTWLKEWRAGSNLNERQIALCPGNHDLAFSEDPANPKAPIDAASPTATAEYGRMYEQLFFQAPNAFQCSGRRLLLGGLTPVEIVCLNSSYLQQTKSLFQGHGFVGDDQLRHVAAEMGWDTAASPDHPLRILVVHHHVMPVTYREPLGPWPYSVVLDAEALLRWVVQHRISLVLHGHMHQPFYAKLTRPETFEDSKPLHQVHVLGMGSTGVARNHLGEVDKNVFALLDIVRNRVTVEYHSIHPTNPSQRLSRRELVLEI